MVSLSKSTAEAIAARTREASAGLADGDAARALLKARRSARRLTVRKTPPKSADRNAGPTSFVVQLW